MKILLCVRVPSQFEIHRRPQEHIPAIQPQSYWLRAMNHLGWHVSVFRYTDSTILPSKRFAQFELWLEKRAPTLFLKWRQLLNRGYRLNPDNWLRSLKLKKIISQKTFDLIIITKGISELASFPFEYTKSRKIPCFFFCGEDPEISLTEFEKANVKKFDHIVINDPSHVKKWHQLGARNVIALPYAAADPEVQRKLTKVKQKYDVVFVGTLIKARQRDLLKFKRSGINVAIFGYIPRFLKLNPELQSLYHGEAWGKMITKIYNQSRMAINFIDPTMPGGGNLRTFEIPACGTLQIANRCPKEWFIPGKEIVLFTSIEDLKKKINYYLTHEIERKQIAAAGYKRAHRDHTYTRRFKAILDFV